MKVLILQGYDNRLVQYIGNITNIHGPDIRNSFRRLIPQPKNGAQQVTEELEHLNRRFAQLSSLILERRNIMQVLIQNWKRKKQASNFFYIKKYIHFLYKKRLAYF